MADVKRRKAEIDEEKRFFENFLSNENNKRLIKNLRYNLEELEMGTRDLTSAFLHIKCTNAFRSASFNRANCDVVSIKELGDEPVAKVIPTASLFMDGYSVLAVLLDEENPRIPEEHNERQALKELLKFIISDHSILIDDIKDKSIPEADLAVRLAQHLMTPLVPNKTFVIDANYVGLQLQQCCSAGHPMNGKKGDTSFGCLEGWHGHVDILMMDKEVPFCVEGDSIEEAEASSQFYSEHPESSVEFKTNGDFKPDRLEQLMAQTIVFSFLQNKENKNRLKTSLVPGIGICAEKLVIHLYDCIEDVLLESFPLPLLIKGKKKLNLRAVMILWMTLNYKIFCSGIPHRFKQEKCDFHKILSAKKLDMYKHAVEMPLHVKRSDREWFYPDWAGTEPCIRLRNMLMCEKKCIEIKKQSRAVKFSL